MCRRSLYNERQYKLSSFTAEQQLKKNLAYKFVKVSMFIETYVNSNTLVSIAQASDSNSVAP